MTFREKTAWIALVSTFVVFGLYFRLVYEAGPHAGFPFGLLVGTVVALVILQVVPIVIFAVLSPKDAQAPRDERDKLIELRAIRIAYAGLASGVVLVCILGVFDPTILANVNSLLFVLLTAEVLRLAALIFQYRRGA